MAGHTAYAGVLVALDSVLGEKKTKTKEEKTWERASKLCRKQRCVEDSARHYNNREEK